jgi:ubiquinone/menaquinone biosynthesis C-methylase UbiE
MAVDIDREGVEKAYGRWAPIYDLVFGKVFDGGRQSTIAEADRIGGRILDVGVGTGLSLSDYARSTRICGVDISEPMLATARARAQRDNVPATFICADAQTHTFDAASFDMIISRFGVMFFDDPVRAFANLRRAVTRNAELRAIAWRAPADNPFMTTAERAAAPLLSSMPPRRPDAPGQFAFADADRVRRILNEAGWNGIDLQPLDVECTLPVQALHLYVTRLGPVGMMLQSADEAMRTRVTEIVLDAFKPYVRGADVHFTAACWIVSARS